MGYSAYQEMRLHLMEENEMLFFVLLHSMTLPCL